MHINKCDLCGKTIKDDKLAIYAGFRWSLSAYELCDKCGLPIAKFLRKNKLTKNDPIATKI